MFNRIFRKIWRFTCRLFYSDAERSLYDWVDANTEIPRLKKKAFVNDMYLAGLSIKFHPEYRRFTNDYIAYFDAQEKEQQNAPV